MPVPDLSTTTLATPVCAPLGLVPMPCVETPEEVADLSSTGTSSNFTPDAQPAKRATIKALAKNLVVMFHLIQ
jgi:hypothetical protein